MSLIENENTRAKQAWDTNAAFWDEQMGEGNDFFNLLLWPAIEKLLKPEMGEAIGCGLWKWPNVSPPCKCKSERNCL